MKFFTALKKKEILSKTAEDFSSLYKDSKISHHPFQSI